MVIHTPVVNDTKVSGITATSNSEENQWIEETKEKYSKDVAATLVLGKEFKLTIPHEGTHINVQGYGTKEYNYEGLKAEDGTLFDNSISKLSFAKGRQVKFSFGVIYKKVYKPANEWIDLEVSSIEDFYFIIPEWEKELWKTGKHTIETRVIAENCTDSLLNKTEVGANKNSKNYVAVKTLKVNIIGELMDLEIRATNDPNFSNYKNEGISGMPIGQLGQANAGNSYKYGLKLGAEVYFDITSTGWTGDTTEQVNITPKYYFISKAGGKAKLVDLYYKQQGVSGYVSLQEKPRTLETTMNTDAVKGTKCKSRFASLIGTTGLFNANAGVEMSNTTRLIPLLRKEDMANYLNTANKNVVNYGTKIKTGTTNLVTLPYTVRLAYTNAVNAMLSEKYKEVSGLEVVSENVKNYCIGHWYGAFKIPATTVAVNPGETPKPDKSNVKTGGYIIVSFEEVKSIAPGGTPYLKVDPENFTQEGADTDFTLPNGEKGKTPELVPAIIYESDIAINQDYEVGGTH